MQTPRWAGGNKKQERLDADYLLCQDISLWVREASCNLILGGFMCFTVYIKKAASMQFSLLFFLTKKDNDGSQGQDIFKNKWQHQPQILTSHVKAKRVKTKTGLKHGLNSRRRLAGNNFDPQIGCTGLGYNFLSSKGGDKNESAQLGFFGENEAERNRETQRKGQRSAFSLN